VWKHSRASGSALLVLLKIADECDDLGQTWAAGLKLATVAAAGRVSLRQARRCCSELEDLGELQRIDQPGRGRASRYVMLAYRRREGIVDPDNKEGGGVRLIGDDKADGIDRLSDDIKADAQVRLSRKKADIHDANRRTPTSGPIDVPCTVPTTTDSPTPTLPPGESGAGAPRELTDQQRAVGRVQTLFAHAGLPEPTGKTVAGMVRNAGGFARIDELMAIGRGLANRGALSERSLFEAIRATRRTPAAGNRRSRQASRQGSRPATLDDARRQRLEEIERASASSAG
jgi:hypothetical protein